MYGDGRNWNRAAPAPLVCAPPQERTRRRPRCLVRIPSGAHIEVLQQLLGHKTATLTSDRYRHLFPDDLDRIAVAFDAAAESTADDLRTIVFSYGYWCPR